MQSIQEMREEYSSMSLVQKKQFCQSFRKSVESNKTPESTKFLNECITIYNEEYKASKESANIEKNETVIGEPEKIADNDAKVKVKAKAEPESASNSGVEISNKQAYIIGAVFLVVVIVLLIFIPFLRWILLFGALGWLVFAFIKKANKAAPIIVSVIALSLLIFLPSGNSGGGGGLNGTWESQGGNIPNATSKITFDGNRYSHTIYERNSSNTDRGTFSISGNTITFISETWPSRDAHFSRSGNTITLGALEFTRVR